LLNVYGMVGNTIWIDVVYFLAFAVTQGKF